MDKLKRVDDFIRTSFSNRNRAEQAEVMQGELEFGRERQKKRIKKIIDSQRKLSPIIY